MINNKQLKTKIPKSFRFRKPNGFPIGKDGMTWLCVPDKEEGHFFITGGTGSGKTSSMLIPLLIHTKMPSLVLDVKGDMFDAMTPYYKTGIKTNNFVLFNPTSSSSDGYDPFAFISKKHKTSDLLNIAACIIPTVPGKDEFWQRSGQAMLAGGLMYGFESGLDFGQALRRIQSMTTEKLVTEALDFSEEHSLDEIRLLLAKYDGMASETLTSVAATVSAAIVNLAVDPDLQNAFAKRQKTIKPSMLLEGDDIYIQIPESRINIYRPFLQLLIGQFFQYFEDLEEVRSPQLNIVLDELARIGKIDSIEDALATLRSRGVRIICCCQSFKQIEKLYGETGAAALADNFPFKILLSASDPKTQRYYSDIIGKQIQYRKSNTYKGDSIFGKLTTSYNDAETEVYILRPEQLAYLEKDAVFLSPRGFCVARKQPYYDTAQDKKLRSNG